MLDFSWAELLVIVAVAVLVIGPREIPVVMRALGRAVRRLQYVRFALSQQFEDFMKEHDLDEMRAAAPPRGRVDVLEDTDDVEKSSDEESHVSRPADHS